MTPELHQGRTRAISVDGIRQKPMFDSTGAKIAVVGLDPDGFSLAKRAADRGFETIAFDQDEVKVAQLEAYDAKETRNLLITSDAARLHDADIVVISIIGANGSHASLDELHAAATLVGRQLREATLVIVESVVYPGVCEHVILPALEKSSGLTRPSQEHGNSGFLFAHAPSRGEDSPRIIAASNKESLARASGLFRTLGSEIEVVRSIKDAEAVRMVEDSLHDVALGLAGEFSILFDRIGIDMPSVMHAIGASSIATEALSGIGEPRSSSAPYYLARSGHEHHIDLQFLSTARRIIDYMPVYAVNMLAELLRQRKVALKDATVALLGLSDGGDKSVGFRILDSLEKNAGEVRVYDPSVARTRLDLKQTLEGADAAIVASDLPIFRNLSPRQFEELGVLTVVDARNCLDKEAFADSSVTYRGIGRG